MLNMTYPVVGLTGKAAAGKDTVGNYISSQLLLQDRFAMKIACADELKLICSRLFKTAFDVPEEAFYGTQAEKEAPLEAVPGWTGRKILQFVGTECFRSIHGEVWSREMIGRARHLITSGRCNIVVVADVRFLSEAKAIQDAGGIVVRVKRPEADCVESTHASETELAHIKEDYVIDNQGRELYLLENLVKDFVCQLNF